MLSVYGQGERDGDETLTSSWEMHITNKVLLEIKKTLRNYRQKNYDFNQEFGLPQTCRISQKKHSVRLHLLITNLPDTIVGKPK